MAVAVLVSLILTMLVGKKKLGKKEMGNNLQEEAVEEKTCQVSEKENSKVELKAFLKGNVIPLSEAGDGVFSEGVMGSGLAIIPENDILYAPTDATVAVVMEDSRHACGLVLDNGMELLLHIGIDTVEMQGDGFEYLIKEGQKVKAGTPLIRFNRQKIKEAGYSDVTVCVITDGADEKTVHFHTGIYAQENETVIIEIE